MNKTPIVDWILVLSRFGNLMALFSQSMSEGSLAGENNKLSRYSLLSVGNLLKIWLRLNIILLIQLDFHSSSIICCISYFWKITKAEPPNFKALLLLRKFSDIFKSELSML